MSYRKRSNRISSDARAIAIDNPFLWSVAARLDYPTKPHGGRANSYPLWVFFIWMVLIHEYGSSRRVEEALSDIEYGPWLAIRDAAIREFGEDRPELVPAEAPPTRNQFNYALKWHLAPNIDAVAEDVRVNSQMLALAMGLGTEDAAGSLAKPTVERVAYGDVTVMTARTKTLGDDARQVNRNTGEVVYRRHDEDAARHTTGGGAVVPGLPFAFTHIRGRRRNEHVILAVDPVTPKGRSEGHLAVDHYLEAATKLTGLVGFAYDRALRGQHLDRLLKAGHIGLVGTYKEKGRARNRFHGIETHHPRSGTPRDIEIQIVGGAPHIRRFDVKGDQQFTPLQRRRINRRVNRRDGRVRLSAEYEVTDAAGEVDGYVRIRLDQTAEDQLAGYNRPEHLRAFPEGDPIFEQVQKRLRASAESANRAIDDHHPRERLHHFGFTKNTLSMLAWQVYRNAQTQAVFAPNLRLDPPLAAAG